MNYNNPKIKCKECDGPLSMSKIERDKWICHKCNIIYEEKNIVKKGKTIYDFQGD